jgi:hypothetical protein
MTIAGIFCTGVSQSNNQLHGIPSIHKWIKTKHTTNAALTSSAAPYSFGRKYPGGLGARPPATSQKKRGPKKGPRHFNLHPKG